MSKKRIEGQFPRFYAQVGLGDEVVVRHIEELAKYDIVTLGDIQVTRRDQKSKP